MRRERQRIAKRDVPASRLGAARAVRYRVASKIGFAGESPARPNTQSGLSSPRRSKIMTITRWSPLTLSPARGLSGADLDQLFDGLFTQTPARGDVAPVFAPAVDIEETADEFVFKADLPGVSQKDVKVNLLGDTLT